MHFKRITLADLLKKDVRKGVIRRGRQVRGLLQLSRQQMMMAWIKVVMTEVVRIFLMRFKI